MAQKINFNETEPDYIMELTLENNEVMTVEAFEASYIEDKTLPEGYHSYYTRHRDNDWTEPCSIKKNKGLTVNFWGTIVTDRPIDFGNEDELEITNINEI